jgi:hypothetical protein
MRSLCPITKLITAIKEEKRRRVRNFMGFQGEIKAKKDEI